MLIDLLVLVIVVGLLFYVLSLLPLPLWLLGMVGYLGPAWPHHYVR